MKKKPKAEAAQEVQDSGQLRQRFKERRLVQASELKRNPLNWRTHPEDQRRDVSKLLEELGQIAPVLAVETPDGLLMIDGHLRSDIAGNRKIAVDLLDLSPEEVRVAIALFDSVGHMAGINAEIAAQVAADLRAERPEWGEQIEAFRSLFSTPGGMLPAIEGDAPAPAPGSGNRPQEERLKLVRQKLTERFVVPPMTVLDARQGYWSDRRKAWLALGIKSEEGRGQNLLNYSKTLVDPQRIKTDEIREQGYTSVFDPVVCELAYRWFSAPGDIVLDPFCGGSVRGVVGAALGRRYHGVDLREEQILENRKQAEDCLTLDDPAPTWLPGDAADVQKLFPGLKARLIFSCPPYGNLEEYSKDPRDISNKTYPKFLAAYRQIIKAAAEMLEEDSFAVWVVGDFRDKKGNLTGFIGDTIRAFQDAGLGFYNECILHSLATAAIRAGRLLQGSRKIVKVHQNVLVFIKGDWRKAVARLGDVQYGEVPTAWIDADDLEQTVDAAQGIQTPFGEKLTAENLGGEI
jgi:hypothetical protein